jgi:hypothetical protein
MRRTNRAAVNQGLTRRRVGELLQAGPASGLISKITLHGWQQLLVTRMYSPSGVQSGAKAARDGGVIARGSPPSANMTNVTHGSP